VRVGESERKTHKFLAVPKTLCHEFMSTEAIVRDGGCLGLRPVLWRTGCRKTIANNVQL
jgi:hypothetical protein